jgi:hypothetical protein
LVGGLFVVSCSVGWLIGVVIIVWLVVVWCWFG